ncbi:MAG: DMT family transporter [Patescibacteria group bacterium]|nr:DMT family transporter [Patescibacteria group bacterium]
MNLGVIFALGALLGWSFGDFSIQKTVRAIGNVRAIFYISITGGILLLPFIWREIIPAFSSVSNFPLIIFACILVLVTALANFEGLKKGKLSVVLPINGVELVIAIALAALISGERYHSLIYLGIVLVFVGLLLTTITSIKNLTDLKWEKGVAWALTGAILLGVSNYTIGLTSRTFSPIFSIWLTHSVAAIATFLIMLKRKEISAIRNDLKNHFNIIAAQSLLDNLAWISFAYATTLIPIGIATTISEGYLALGAILGMTINQEKLRRHQLFGVALTIISVLLLSWLIGV